MHMSFKPANKCNFGGWIVLLILFNESTDLATKKKNATSISPLKNLFLLGHRYLLRMCNSLHVISLPQRFG
jgi:hypothetical protein